MSKPKGKVLHGEEERLIAEWRLIYAQASLIEEYSDKRAIDWESLCIGWCLAKGLSIKTAYAFYQKMIPLGLF